MARRGRLLYNVAAIALAGAIFGIDSGIIATTLGSDTFLIQLFPPGTHNVEGLTGAIVSASAAGAAFVCLFSGSILEMWGRKRPLAVSTLFTIAGAILQAACNGPAMMIFGRLLSGMALGIMVPTAPVYITELSKPHTRARLVSIFGIMVAIGFCLANWFGYFCSFAEPKVSWRLALALQIPMALLLQVLSVFLPESPRWLAQRERYEEFDLTMRELYSDEEEILQHAVVEIREQIYLETAQRSKTTLGYGLLELFTRNNIVRTGTAILIMQIPALGGTLAIQNYQAILYQSLGFHGRQVLLISACYGFMGIAGQVVNSLVVSDKVSRRTTIIVGGIVLTVELAILMALSKYYGSGSNGTGPRTAVSFIFIYSATYALFFNSTIFTIAAEYFPTHLRGYGTSVGVLFQNVTNLWLGQITPTIFAAIMWRYYAVFIACLLALTAFFAAFLKETNQVPLEAIAGKFGDQATQVKTGTIEDGEIEQIGAP